MLPNRQLEDELQAEKEHWRTEREELKSELERLLLDNEKLQNLFTESLTDDSSNPAQAYLQYEVSRLTQENLVSYLTNFDYGLLCSSLLIIKSAIFSLN